MTGEPTNGVGADDERGSEVDDYTGEVPRVAAHTAQPEPDGPQPSGYGDGDVADIVDTDDSDAQADDVRTEPAQSNPDYSDYTGDDIAAVIAERDQYKETAIRLQADFENFRKRSANQAAGDIDRATGRLAAALLPVFDAAESAYVQHPDEVGPLLNQMLTELKKLGLEALDLAGHPFDPELADAVQHEPGKGGEIVVAEVLRSGYLWKNRTLRPAMVRTTD